MPKLTIDKNKWIEAVGKLITLTQKKRLTWITIPPPPDLIHHNLRRNVIYEANYKGKRLRLYERQDKVLLNWSSVLELVDFSNSVWTFPSTQAIDDLLAAVQYQTGQVSEFVEELLAEAV
jgi:hypothetical protein